MSSQNKLTIVCLNINNESKEKNDESNLLFESPEKIFDEFLEIHLFLETEKIEKKSSEIKYILPVNFNEKEQIIFEIYVVNDLSFIHEISLKTDANLIFLNLENKKILDQLEKVTNYINDSCLKYEVITYLVGIYQNEILPTLNEESIRLFFEDQKLDCEIYQIKYDQNNTDNHICLYENKQIKKNKKEKEKEKKNRLKKNKNPNLIDILERILVQIYETKIKAKINDIKNKNKNKKYKKKEDNNQCQSAADCLII